MQYFERGGGMEAWYHNQADSFGNPGNEQQNVNQMREKIVFCPVCVCVCVQKHKSVYVHTATSAPMCVQNTGQDSTCMYLPHSLVQCTWISIRLMCTECSCHGLNWHKHFMPTQTHTHTYLHIYIHPYIHIWYAGSSLCILPNIYIYIYIYIYTHTHTHTHTYKRTRTHMVAYTHPYTYAGSSGDSQPTHTHTHMVA